jgi:seryl-tRNA synthetase
MNNKTNTDERLAQLDEEWRRKYEELDNLRQRQLRELAEDIKVDMKAMIRVICDAMNLVQDADTGKKMVRAIKTGLARLNTIDAAKEAEREPGAPLN